MIVTIDGQLIRLYPEVAVMIVALIDHQESIHKQGMGEVSLDFHGCDITYTLNRRNYRAKARKIVDKITSGLS